MHIPVVMSLIFDEIGWGGGGGLVGLVYNLCTLIFFDMVLPSLFCVLMIISVIVM